MKDMKRLFVIALLPLATACGGGGASEAKATISAAATSVGGAVQTAVPTVQAAAGTAVGAAQSLASPSATPAHSPSPVTTTSALVTAPSGATVKITSPAPNASAPAGTLRVTYDVTGATLVPAAEARRVEDLHIHVLLDVDPAPYLGTTTAIPAGNPDIVHTAAREVTFNDVRPGQHRVSIILTGANHVSLDPPVSDSVTFTVQ